MSGELGKASLDLEAELTRFEANIDRGGRSVEGLDHKLEALTAIANVAEHALNDVGLSPGRATESRISAEAILSGVKGISDESRDAALELDRVHLSETQAAETEASGGVIRHVLNAIGRDADQAKRKLLEMKLAGGPVGRSGVGVGPFGSGFGRVGLLGAAVGVGALAAPAAGPAAIGLLGAIPTLAFAGAGALGTLALAFGGVGKAIGGDKKAFDDLSKPAQQFVQTVRSLDGLLERLKKTAAASLFPGLTAGLKAALSPGTVNAFFTAITELGHALGHVGAQFGRYFGSAAFQKIFGPLMQSAARNVRVLGDAALHLFDAFGVLARAAIPFFNWLTSAIDKGAKLADSWIHAKNASGALAGAFDKAKSSLTLVAKLAGALIGVIVQLGKALYPVSQVFLKDLIAGLDALGSAVGKAAPDIRGALGGALGSVVAAVRVAGPAIGTLADVLLKLIGVLGRALVPVIRGLKPVFDALQIVFRQLEPPLAKIIHDLGDEFGGVVKALAKPLGDLIQALGPVFVGALKVLDPLLRASGKAIVYAARAFGFLIEQAARALTWIEHRWHGIVGFFKNLGHGIENAFKAVWRFLERGALKAALAIVEPFSHLPKWLGGGPFQRMKASLQGTLAAMDRDTGVATRLMGDHFARMANRVAGIFAGLVGTIKDAFNAVGAAVGDFGKKYRSHHDHQGGPKPGTHAWYMQNLGYDPTQEPTFGKPPPFTKNLGTSGSRSAQPQSALNLEALARRQDQEAAALGYSGKKAREHLHKEITDLEKADKILEEKLKHAHGKRRTEIYDAITANEKKIAEARKRLHDAAAKARQQQLNLALDQAKQAVENAQEGSKAYDRAVAAEEKALKAEIRYWDRRAHNAKLSAEARDKALRKEIEYEKQLKALKKQLATATSQAAAANEAQFLQSFAAIQNAFGSNFQPVPPPSGKTDTHLYDLKNEARESNRHLKAIRDKGRFPGSRMGVDSAVAATS